MGNDPWAAHVATFRVSDAQVTAVPLIGALMVEHGLALMVAEGRQEALDDEAHGGAPRTAFEYFCRITMDGAAEPDFWSGDDAQIVVTGTHENGARITIAGLGAIGRDNNGSLEIDCKRGLQAALPRHG